MTVTWDEPVPDAVLEQQAAEAGATPSTNGHRPPHSDGRPEPGGRVPPHDLDAERALLGALLLSSDAVAAVAEVLLGPEAFYRPSRAHVYTAISALAAQGVGVDPITVADELRRRDQLDDVGGASALVELMTEATSTANAADQARILADHALLRRLIGRTIAATETAYSGQAVAAEVVAELNSDLNDLANATSAASSWDAVDHASTLDALLAGTLDVPRPTIGTVVGSDLGLFTPGATNGIHAQSGAGKTLIAESIAVEQLNAGAVVWLIDLEDHHRTALERMLDLGADPDALRHRFKYRHPEETLTAAGQARLDRALATERPSLVIVDSTGEWLGLDGVDEHDTAIASWFRTGPRRLTAHGAAVVLIDHVPMGDRERLDPIGSQRKKAAITGQQYLATTVAELGRDRIGRTRLIVAKDRAGWRAKGTIAAEFHLDATRHPYDWSFLPAPDGATGSPAEGPLADTSPAVRRTHAALLAHHAEHDSPATVAALGDLLANDGDGPPLKARTIQSALADLLGLGLVARSAGMGNAHLWTAIPMRISSGISDPPSAHPHAHTSDAHTPTLDPGENPS